MARTLNDLVEACADDLHRSRLLLQARHEGDPATLQRELMALHEQVFSRYLHYLESAQCFGTDLIAFGFSVHAKLAEIAEAERKGAYLSRGGAG